MRYILCCLSILFVSSISAANDKQSIISDLAKIYGQKINISAIRLSPSGKKLAIVISKNEEDILVINEISVEGNKPVFAIRLASYKEEDKEKDKIYANWIEWLSEDRLLYSFSKMTRYSGTRYKFLASHLMAVDYTGANKVYLSLQGNTKRLKRYDNDDVLSLLPNDPDHILVGYSFKDRFHDDVYKLNVNTGEMELVLKLPKKKGIKIHDWYADRDGLIRMGFGEDKKDKPVMLVHNPETNDWKELQKNELFKDGRFRPLAFSNEKEILYALSSHINGRLAVFRFNVSTGELDGKVFGHDKYDIMSTTFLKSDGSLASVNYYDDTIKRHYLDKDYGIFRDTIDHALSGNINTIVSSSRSDRQVVIFSSGPKESGVYYFYDRDAKKIVEIGLRYDDLYPEQLSEVKSITFEARDALPIPGYLTLPNGYEEGKSYPTVIMPHGGPHFRDVMGFNYFAQYISRLGYIVYQPNFRGSSGYGSRYRALGYGQWGGTMQDDIVDGTKWLIKQGISDPENICILGASYGGYAALMGTINNPELFKCGVSYAGVADIKRMLKDDGNYDVDDINYYRVAGNRKKSKLKEISPIKLIKKLKRPILLAHGEYDRVVDVMHSQEFFKLGKKYKKDVKYIEFPEEIHKLVDEKNTIKFLTEVGQFLNKHIPINKNEESLMKVASK